MRKNPEETTNSTYATISLLNHDERTFIAALHAFAPFPRCTALTINPASATPINVNGSRIGDRRSVAAVTANKNADRRVKMTKGHSDFRELFR
jgi:hypothetical protein